MLAVNLMFSVVVQMLQLALRQQQLHAAHMQIKLQHQTNMVVGEHTLSHHHHQCQQQQQRRTSLSVDEVGGSLGRGTWSAASDELNDAACSSATGATWRTDDELHTTTARTTVDQPSLQTVSRV